MNPLFRLQSFKSTVLETKCLKILILCVFFSDAVSVGTATAIPLQPAPLTPPAPSSTASDTSAYYGTSGSDTGTREDSRNRDAPPLPPAARREGPALLPQEGGGAGGTGAPGVGDSASVGVHSGSASEEGEPPRKSEATPSLGASCFGEGREGGSEGLSGVESAAAAEGKGGKEGSEVMMDVDLGAEAGGGGEGWGPDERQYSADVGSGGVGERDLITARETSQKACEGGEEGCEQCESATSAKVLSGPSSGMEE